jgi:hypothetical protein
MRYPSRGCNSVRNRGDGARSCLYLDQRWRLYRSDVLRLVGPAIYLKFSIPLLRHGRARSEVEAKERLWPTRRYGYEPTLRRADPWLLKVSV